MAVKASERSKLEPYAWVIDALGFPQIDQVIPMPAEIFEEAGIRSPADIILQVRDNARSGIMSGLPTPLRGGSVTMVKGAPRLANIFGVLDDLGLPAIDEVIPMPAEVAADVGLPTPDHVFGSIKSGIRSKAQGLRRGM